MSEFVDLLFICDQSDFITQLINDEIIQRSDICFGNDINGKLIQYWHWINVDDFDINELIKGLTDSEIAFITKYNEIWIGINDNCYCALQKDKRFIDLCSALM